VNHLITGLRNSVFHVLGTLLFRISCSGAYGTPSDYSPGFGKTSPGAFDDQRDSISSHQNEFTACEEEENLDDSPFERSSRQIIACQSQAVSDRDLSGQAVQSAKRSLLFCCLKVDCWLFAYELDELRLTMKGICVESY
jgi:hypothetical protein